MSLTDTFSSINPPRPQVLAWPFKHATGSKALTSASVDEDARALQHIGTKARVARNEPIFSQGDSAAYAYKVVSGVVRLCKHLSDGRRHVSRRAEPAG